MIPRVLIPRVSILISDNGSAKIRRTLDSLKDQSLQPLEILREQRGTVSQSRNLMFTRSSGNIIAFIDTDEYAPREWLAKLTLPLSTGKADYTCGPTRPGQLPFLIFPYARYLSTMEERHYKMCATDQTIYPMGNTAWKREVFESISVGGKVFDERFTHGGEDYDVNLRATKLEFRGLFIPQAWVYHNQSDINTAWKIIKKKFRYSHGGHLARMKNRPIPRFKRTRLPRMFNPLEVVQKVAEVYGWTRAWTEIHLGRKLYKPTVPYPKR